MAAEVAVGEGAELFEVAEGEALWVSGEGGEDAEAGALVDDAVETLIGEATFVEGALDFIAFPPAWL